MYNVPQVKVDVMSWQHNIQTDNFEEIAVIEGFHAKAIWVSLNKPSYWRGAAMFLYADNVSASYWKKRNDFLKLPPHLEDCDTDDLAKAISSYFSCK